MKNHLSLEVLQEKLSYNPDSGLFIWNKSSGTKKKGAEAGSVNNRGYIFIGLNKYIYLAHRLAWFYQYGLMPDLFIDHINGNKTDNRIENLRLVSRAENAENQKKAHADSLTGFLGVTFMRKIGKYQAQIKHAGKIKYLGVYKSAEQAHQVYLSAKRNIHSCCTI